MKPEIILAAFLGTIAFSILYDIPPRFLVTCGLVGTAGWCVYYLLLPLLGGTGSIFLATVTISLLSRYCAVWKKAPEVVFILAGIFTLVPGAGIYWTAYFLVSGQISNAVSSGSDALKACFAMVLGIAIVHELPQFLFSGRKIKS